MIIVSLTLNKLISQMKALTTILGLYQLVVDSLYVTEEINPLICIFGMIIVSLTLNKLISQMKALTTILGLYQLVVDSLYVTEEINPLICIFGIPNPKTLN
jgi:succinyl-CoA synthetase beta subunit